MKLCNIGHGFNYELEKLCRIFLPFEKIEILDHLEQDDRLAVSELIEENGKYKAKAYLLIDGKSAERTADIVPGEEELFKVLERSLAIELFY